VSARPIDLTRRSGKGLETMILGGLTFGAVALLAVYAGGLLYLVGRGLGKIASFTTYATPLDGIDGEVAMRIALAFLVFGTLGWAAHALAMWVLALVRRPVGRGIERISFFTLLAAGAVVAVLARDHLPRFLVSLPTETKAGGGVGPEIFNTLYFAVLSTAISLPIGVGAAVYIARFAPRGPLAKALRVALSTLASLPSIVYGLFGFLVFVVAMKAGYSLFAGACVLALLNLPLVVSLSEESILAVPRELEEASYALGATRVQTTARVTLPHAWPGILSAMVLSIGRVFSESAPLIMTAGTTISRSNAYALNPFRGGETLAVHLWYVNSAGLCPDRADVSAGTAAVLISLVALTNVFASRLARRTRSSPRARTTTKAKA